MPRATCSGRRGRPRRPRTRSNRLPVAPIIDGGYNGYNLGMPSVRLTIIVRLDQAASLDRLAEFVEVRRTVIGTDVSVLLTAADGPAATKLFTDLGALAIPFEATAAIGDTHYLVSGDGNQMSVVEAWAATPAGVWSIHLDEPMAPWKQTPYGNTNGPAAPWTASPKPRAEPRYNRRAPGV